MRSSGRRGWGGFSLIELLVAISIIALMMGMLLPVLSSARERGRSAVCANNLRQVMLGALLFVEEDSRRSLPVLSFPVRPLELGALDPMRSWVYTLKPYVDPHLIAVCPSDRSPYWSQERPGMAGRLREVSYGINGVVGERDTFVGADPTWPPTPAYQKDTDAIQRPSNLVVFGELAERNTYAIGDYFTPFTWGVEPAQVDFQFRYQLAAERHANAPQWVFFDGHVAADALSELYDPGDYDPEAGSGEWVHNKFHPMIAR